MLPQSQHYLEHGGYSPQQSAYLLIGLFLLGVIGIQILSRVLHHFLPSHVVDCDHTHDEDHDKSGTDEEEQRHSDHERSNGAPVFQFHHHTEDDEDTPLLARTNSISPPKQRRSSMPNNAGSNAQIKKGTLSAPSSRRSSLVPRNISRTLTRFYGTGKSDCEETGPCMGYSDPCGQDCFKALSRRGTGLPGHGNPFHSHNISQRFSELHFPAPVPESEETTEVPSAENPRSAVPSRNATRHYHHPERRHHEPLRDHGHVPSSDPALSQGLEHHHHVPTNAFLSIGVQTSLAIALHKAPEGFITYATNHANPTLGFAVFMALFIHNITEGFAMSLPLYLAFGSRLNAIIWSSVLGGVSQPLGAGIAALWFRVSQRHGGQEPSEAVYGGMFALTAGIMTSVALSLFSESLTLSHNRGICTTFAFLGMGILGLSFALTAR